MLSHVCKGLQTWPSFMAGTPLQCKRRASWLFEKQKTVYVGLGPMAREETHRESQLVHEWSDALGEILGPCCKNRHLPCSTALTKAQIQSIYFSCGVSTQISKRHFYQKDQDTKMQRKHWLICTRRYDKIAESFLSQKLKGNACKISSILQCKGIFSGEALICAEYFAEEQPQPTSSSSWTPSSSWWTSSSWTSDWHQHEWEDMKW